MIRKYLPYALMILSGFAGLGYEMVWVRSLSSGLGHEIISTLSVLAAFFVGTAAGAGILDRPVRSSSYPGRWYAALELTIGLWAVALTFLIPKTALLGAELMGVDPPAFLRWGVTFLLPLVLLLPATMAMGATLPAMDCLSQKMKGKNRLVGGLYGANTLGAMAGILATTFWMVPAMGFGQSQYLLAVLNLLCAWIALIFSVKGKALPSPPAEDHIPSSSPPRLMLTLFVTGLLGIGFEVIAVRIISQVLENTVFSYTALLSVYLLGTAAGAAYYQTRPGKPEFARTASRLLMVQALSCTAGMWILNFCPEINTFFRQFGIRTAEFCLAACVFLGPTLVMGALFSHLAQAAKQGKRGLGPALAFNTLGCAAAPFLFGIFLMPLLGPAGCCVLICAGYLLLLPLPSRKWLLPAAGCSVAAGLIFTIPAPFDFTRPAPGEQVISHVHGIMASVTVIQDTDHEFHLKVNNHYQMGGTASRYSDQRQAHIPLLLHPDPKNVLFLGLGTGTTFATALHYKGLQADGVELIPEVVRLIPNFQPGLSQAQDKTMHVFTADARRFVLGRKRQYDVIIADLFHPSRDGAGFLYTSEHFRAIRQRLSKNGIFCQWLPLYQMDLDLLRLIARTFLNAFSDGAAFLAHHSLTQPMVGLIGSREPLLIREDTFTRTAAGQPGLDRHLQSVGLSSIYTLLGCYLADSRQLQEFAGPGPLNTDDFPRVLFQAPEFVYAESHQTAGAVGRIMDLVRTFSPRPQKLLDREARGIDKGRLAAYWKARNAYLAIGADQLGKKDALLPLAGKLLEVVRMSPDFDSAFRPLLIMAGKIHEQNPRVAEKLLTALESAAPMRTETGQIRKDLSKGI